MATPWGGWQCSTSCGSSGRRSVCSLPEECAAMLRAQSTSAAVVSSASGVGCDARGRACRMERAGVGRGGGGGWGDRAGACCWPSWQAPTHPPRGVRAGQGVGHGAAAQTPLEPAGCQQRIRLLLRSATGCRAAKANYCYNAEGVMHALPEPEPQPCALLLPSQCRVLRLQHPSKVPTGVCPPSGATS